MNYDSSFRNLFQATHWFDTHWVNSTLCSVTNIISNFPPATCLYA